MVSNFVNLLKTLMTSSRKAATKRTRLLQLVSASFFSLSATIAHSDSVEITLFEGMVLELPEDADQHTIRSAFIENNSIIKAALIEKSASELFELYRSALIDRRLNNPERNFFDASVIQQTGALAAVVIHDKASDGEPSFLLPAASIRAGQCRAAVHCSGRAGSARGEEG